MYAVDGCSDESNSFRAAKALQECEINGRPRCTLRHLRENKARLRGLEEKLPSDERVKYAAAFHLHLARGKRAEVAAGGGGGSEVYVIGAVSADAVSVSHRRSSASEKVESSCGGRRLEMKVSETMPLWGGCHCMTFSPAHALTVRGLVSRFKF